MTTSARGTSRLICDLTQSWSSVGGGVRTYLAHKREHILERTRHRHLLIIPGPNDQVDEGERAITVTIASPQVPGSSHYRLLLRNRAVRSALERFKPDLIECQDSYNLPWAAIAHRKRYPETVLVGGYFTDFPSVYVERPFARFIGRDLAAAAAQVCYRYCGSLYRRFDALYVLSENGGLEELRRRGIDNPRTVPLGVELGEFRSDRRDPALRRSLGLDDGQPLLIYVGRLHIEKKPDVVVEAFRALPQELGAKLVLLGDGAMREQLVDINDPRIVMPGYVYDRSEIARWLASADIYVSAFAQETFGVSIVEAQASGLPIVGVASGALLDRVNEETGRLGPVNDAEAMARNIVEVWNGDRKGMGEAARERALQFSWDRTFETLFSDVYPLAFANRRAALSRGQTGALVRGTAS
ncbi:MAG: glycosyltransferase [Pseudomonadota bacterium]|nr:glycosyltransferase [Sphingomonas sp.]MDQ3478806.1 glycosyltransferase [Pseudomonadota bacterium]